MFLGNQFNYITTRIITISSVSFTYSKFLAYVFSNISFKYLHQIKYQDVWNLFIGVHFSPIQKHIHHEHFWEKFDKITLFTTKKCAHVQTIKKGILLKCCSKIVKSVCFINGENL